MTIEYNNGENQKLIKNIIHIIVVAEQNFVVALLSNGKELKISLSNIESIIDDVIFD